MSLAQFSNLTPGDIITIEGIDYTITDDLTFEKLNNKKVKWNYIALYVDLEVNKVAWIQLEVKPGDY